jgi:hypothetical protein
MDVRYEIRLQGFLGPALRTAFGELRCEAVARDSTIQGRLSPERLLGILARLDRCGLELVQVSCQVGGAPSAGPAREHIGPAQTVIRPG